MFIRNGEALGSVLHSAAPGAPAKKPAGRKPKAEAPPVEVVVEPEPVVEPVAEIKATKKVEP